MMMDKILEAMVSGKLIRKVHMFFYDRLFARLNKLYWRIIKRIDLEISYIAIRFVSKRTSVDPNKVFFMTTRGDYNCNPKWICDEFLKRNSGCKAVWCIREKTDMEQNRFPPELKLVNRRSLEFYRELASSRMIVDNSINAIYLGYRPKPEQTYIETWHGAIGIKRFNAEEVKELKWKRDAYTSAKYISYLISNSTLEDEIYRECYWKTNPILKFGHARNDILCEGDTPRVLEIRRRVRDYFGIAPETKICLWAPTFRDPVPGRESDMTPYMIDYEGLRVALAERFGGNWVVLSRLHFKTIKQLKIRNWPEGVVNANDYPDIQEILTVADVGITDYSSWICEYLLTKRPGFMFATDIDEYQKDQRGFYYRLETMPYPVARSNEELIAAIRGFKSEGFEEKCEAFLKDKGCMDDGLAAKRTVDKMLELLGKSSAN